MHTKKPNCRHASGCEGFTLMEVAMAILVMGIGLVASFALLTSGLEASKVAQNDSQAVLFADNVLNGLRATNLFAAASSTADDDKWTDLWNKVENGNALIPLAPPNAWQQAEFWRQFRGNWVNSSDKGIKGMSLTGQLVYRVDFKNGAFAGQSRGDPQILNHALRYRLRVMKDDGDQNTPPRVKVELQVWPDKFGSVGEKGRTTFYTEFNNPGNL